MNTALITGGTAGLGRALVAALVDQGWHVVTDGRDAARHRQPLATSPAPTGSPPSRATTPTPSTATRCVAAVDGRLDLLVHNASALGPASGDTRYRCSRTPRPTTSSTCSRHNMGAPLVLTSLLLPALAASGGVLMSISSDAAVEHYPGWGLYSASKAGLDHITLTFAAENPEITAYAVDPGDMRTQMHQDWFPGEDISDRPLPETVVPHLLALLASRPPSGRYRAADFPALRPSEPKRARWSDMPLLDERPATSFTAPRSTFAPAPAERRGVARDRVRLLVADGDRGLTHTRFAHLTEHLRPATWWSSTTPRPSRRSSTRSWSVRPTGSVRWSCTSRPRCTTAPGWSRYDARPTPIVRCSTRSPATCSRSLPAWPGCAWSSPYPEPGSSPTGVGNRLWRADVDGDVTTARRYGRPISYGYLADRYPLSDYQTIFGRRPGSAEMPSAGRPFTAELVTRLVASGVMVAPVTLHTGVSSQEVGEAPQPERFEVSASTAAVVNAARAGGGRVIAVGTTVTRALESAVESAVEPAGDDSRLIAARGWTTRVVTPADPPRIVDGLVTGWHDPEASHLLLVEAVAGPELTQQAYAAAVDARYLWHEFGDSALLLPAAG